MKVRDVVVTGIGLVTPAGIGVDATWNGLLAGTPTARRDPELAGLPTDFSCRVPDFDAARLLGGVLAARLERFAAMAVVAAREAVAYAGLDPSTCQNERVGVVAGTATASLSPVGDVCAKMERGQHHLVSPRFLPRTIPNMSAAEIGLDLGARGPNLVTSTACASGATAIGTALAMLRTGMCDVIVAGGAESMCSPVPCAAFGQMRALSRRTYDPAGASRPFDADRDGFVLAEGAGMLVLEHADHARARGAVPLAVLAGYGASCDAHHPTAPHPEGAGAAQALHAAIADAGLSAPDIAHVNAHGTGTRLNDAAEFRALKAVFERPPVVTANKGALGHTIGAAGAVEAAASVLSLRHQVVPPTANLERQDPDIDLDVVTKVPRGLRMDAVATTSFGFGGQNAVLVFTTP
ncbi:beta-ketoacyl-[acyl-carrier-protein] synthase family protein [Streptodolium elevatio]|uniref:Beta-ketoacyl-[acyl-carrier-protein] synthase family protein n=1 Tax=Streptodolium elevatio TaxID=3157996 RepID=A0ABV3D8P9_9ACTN